MIPTGSGDSLDDADFSRFLERYSQEVLRWNSQFSLISRVEPERRLCSLVEQCLSALRALPAALGDLDAEAAAAKIVGRCPSRANRVSATNVNPTSAPSTAGKMVLRVLRAMLSSRRRLGKSLSSV